PSFSAKRINTVTVGNKHIAVSRDSIWDGDTGDRLWPLSDSATAKERERSARLVAMDAVLNRFARDSAFQARVKKALSSGKAHQLQVPLHMRGNLNGLRPAFLCTAEDFERDPDRCWGEYESWEESCTTIALSIYYATQTLNEDRAEGASASAQMDIDAAQVALLAAAQPIDEPQLAAAVAAFWADSYAYSLWQARVDADLTTLNYLAASYASTGCWNQPYTP